MSKSKKNILDKVESMSTDKPKTSPNVITKDNIDTIDLSQVKFTPGRPVDPNSERQKRLAEIEEKRANGELKRGRPADPNSPSYQKRMEMEARKAQPGYVPKRGRPADPDSAAAKKKAEQLARKSAALHNIVNSGKTIILTEDEDALKVASIVDENEVISEMHDN
jgi:hypothetical protein